MKVMLSGVTSFTGAHIARALKDAGHDVLGSLTGKRQAEYSENTSSGSLSMRERRLRHSLLTNWIEDAPFGSNNYLAGIKNFLPDLIINHGADIKGYRLPDFDVARSVSKSLHNVEEVFFHCKAHRLKKFIHSGTVFEPHDGLPAKSVYGESKSLVALRLIAESESSGIPLSKILIPNPIGALENEDRLIPLFVRQWKSGGTPVLGAPEPISDHIPAEWLAQIYVDEVENVSVISADSNSLIKIRRPSAFTWSNKELVNQFVFEAQKMGVTHNLTYSLGESKTTSLEAPRFGIEACRELANPKLVALFWQQWIAGHWPELNK